MSRPVEGVRSAVITQDLRDDLERYLEFRHLFRNIYGFRLKEERVLPLIKALPGLAEEFGKCAEQFI